MTTEIVPLIVLIEPDKKPCERDLLPQIFVCVVGPDTLVIMKVMRFEKSLRITSRSRGGKTRIALCMKIIANGVIDFRTLFMPSEIG